MIPVIDRVGSSQRPAPRRFAIAAIVVQLWLLTAYLLVDVPAYFDRDLCSPAGWTTRSAGG